ncbi:hypothetical protein J6590_036700 [Homalodisca vitripennis]|nr:hypothetical protein J6590_036700 [Homalodisca vitripennis]
MFRTGVVGGGGGSRRDGKEIKALRGYITYSGESRGNAGNGWKESKFQMMLIEKRTVGNETVSKIFLDENAGCRDRLPFGDVFEFRESGEARWAVNGPLGIPGTHGTHRNDTQLAILAGRGTEEI